MAPGGNRLHPADSRRHGGPRSPLRSFASLRLCGGLALSFALAACSLAPDYQRPEPPVAAAWPAGVDAQGARRAEELDWRAFLPDPRLQALVVAALDHNRDLRAAAARVEEARAQYGVARADRLPNVDLAAGRNAARTPGDLTVTGRPLTSQRYDVNLSMLSFELDFWGRVRSLNDAALAGYLATEEARRAFRLSLVSDVAGAYLALLEAEERSAVAAETARSRRESRDLVAKRRDVGLAGDLDVMQADAAFELSRADLAALERQRAAAANALTLLVGTVPAGLPPGRPLAEQGIVPDLMADLPAEVLLRRPDVLAAEQRLVAANANIGAARAAFLPRILLTAAFGTASRALAGLFDAGSEAWSFQPALRLPLFDAGRAAANADVAEARKVVAVADYEKTVQQAFREVADLLAARDRLAEQLAAQEAAAKAQERVLAIAEARYKAGISSYLEVLDAQRGQYSARQASLQARRAWLANSTQLYKALGGGARE
ncbi:MAG: efflux transporter outer membrane subunit [Rhodocyclaceae bacterium]|nr:efflux transporter outer membrane subunit [Rhodocyclaceae bacterium]